MNTLKSWIYYITALSFRQLYCTPVTVDSTQPYTPHMLRPQQTAQSVEIGGRTAA